MESDGNDTQTQRGTEFIALILVGWLDIQMKERARGVGSGVRRENVSEENKGNRSSKAEVLINVCCFFEIIRFG